MFAIGVACLKARDDVGSLANLAVSIGITGHNLPAATIIWAAGELGLGGLILWAAGIGHGVLGGLFVPALVRVAMPVDQVEELCMSLRDRRRLGLTLGGICQPTSE